MPKQIPMNAVIDATLEGVEKAQCDYEKWTGGEWLWNAPEYLITTSIANKLSDIKGTKYITLENATKSAIDDAGASGQGRLHNHIRDNGKIDIVLWWANGTPRAIIEVKNQIYCTGQYEKDITRIERILLRKSSDSTFQFGMLAFYDSATDGPKKTASQKVNDKFDRIFKKTKKLLAPSSTLKIVTTKMHIDDDSAWAGVCMLIKTGKTAK